MRVVWKKITELWFIMLSNLCSPAGVFVVLRDSIISAVLGIIDGWTGTSLLCVVLRLSHMSANKTISLASRVRNPPDIPKLFQLQALISFCLPLQRNQAPLPTFPIFRLSRQSWFYSGTTHRTCRLMLVHWDMRSNTPLTPLIQSGR